MKLFTWFSASFISLAAIPIVQLSCLADSEVFPGSGSANSEFNLDPFASAGSGKFGNRSQPVEGESHNYSGAGEVNQTTSGMQINDYPSWSTQNHAGAAAWGQTNTPHQQPIGQRGGLAPTTTRSISNLNMFGNDTSTWGSTTPYLGVRNSAHGGIPQVGGSLPATTMDCQVDMNVAQ